MLFIQEDDVVVLTKEHHAAHNICVVLHDQMADIAVNEGYKTFRQPNFAISPNSIYVDELRSGDMHVLEWLEKNGMTSELTDTVISDVMQALLVDFLHFMHESLRAAKKGKISVAYALLRKPMSDLLLIFEQILIDKQGFIDRFYHSGDPVTYDPSFANLNKALIVAQACAKLKLNYLFVADHIHEVRHSKSCAYGIVGITHQALHIVTRDKHYKTPDAYFNFVFDTVKHLESYWKQYYLFVSYLMFYAASVVDEIVFEYMPEAVRIKHVKNIKRFILFMEAHQLPNEPDKIPLGDTLYELMQDAMKHNCKMCQHELKFVKGDFLLFAQEERMLCDQCFTDQFADREFADKFHEAWGAIVPI